MAHYSSRKNFKKNRYLPKITVAMAKICRFSIFLLLQLLLLPLLFSCVGTPRPQLPPLAAGQPAEIPQTAAVSPPPLQWQERPQVPEKPEPSIYIMGNGRSDDEKLALFLEYHNPLAETDFARTLAGLYISEAAFEGVNHDVAFAQMCLETGFLSYGGLVQSEWNNFCGLGAIGPEQPGLIFPDPQTGVRAHIQHLKAYATEEPLNGELVDPRYRFVRKGSSPTIEGLAGTWAVDRQYSVKINAILQRLYDFSF